MFGRKHQHYTPVPGLQGPHGPKGDRGKTGPKGRDWTCQVATWEPLPDTDLDQFREPAAAHAGDAAVDLQTTHRVVLDPHTTVDAHTGWRVNLEPNTSGEVLSRSGLSGKGVIVANAPGLVDPGYTGEVIVRLHNLSSSRMVLDAGSRVAQFRVVPTVIPLSHVGQPERGDDGLGSTGTHAVDYGSGATGSWTQKFPQDTHPGEAEDHDMVNHPPHYTAHPIFTGECWDNLRCLSAAQYAAGKYLWRWDMKGDPAENLDKALWYLRAANEYPAGDHVADIRVLEPGTFRRLDAELTVAEEDTLESGLFTATELYTALAYLDTVRGNIPEAIGHTQSALKRVTNS